MEEKKRVNWALVLCTPRKSITLNNSQGAILEEFLINAITQSQQWISLFSFLFCIILISTYLFVRLFVQDTLNTQIREDNQDFFL